MQDLSLTPTEAGFVTGRSRAAVNRAVDEGVILASFRLDGRRKARLLGRPELRYLRLADALRRDLTPAGRRRLYQAVRRLAPDEHRVEVGPLSVDLEDVDREIDGRLRRLDELRGLVDAGTSEPVLRGTDVSVYVVAGLAQGQTVEEVLEDYPSLTRAQVEGAAEYARVFPKRGRPYPARSFKRMLADLDLGGLETERSAEGPRVIPA